jgi:hypothetical protein
MAPWNASTIRSVNAPNPRISSNAGKSANWKASGRSRTRTWDLFLIRKTFCPLESSQLALNPCKRVQQHDRKTTGDDWRLQPGGPIVAPRPQFEGTASCGLVAHMTPTIRSRPDAGEACRCAPAGWRRPRRASVRGRARPSRARRFPGRPPAVSELVRSIQPSASHAASTASLAFRPRRRGGGEAGAPADDLPASQLFTASREIRAERPT